MWSKSSVERWLWAFALLLLSAAAAGDVFRGGEFRLASGDQAGAIEFSVLIPVALADETGLGLPDGCGVVGLERYVRADRLQLNYKNGQRGFANTANGRVPVFALTLATVRIGDVEVPNVEAVVMPAAMPHVLLGNSFLTRFAMKREADTMRLERR